MDNIVMGNVCQDPVLRQPTRGAQPIARFTIAVNRFRRDGVQWIQRDSVFHRVVCFGPLAENVTNTLRKGMEVVAVGEWADDSYTDEQGQRRVQIVMEARSVGPSLRRATATIQRNTRDTDNQLSLPAKQATGPDPTATSPNEPTTDSLAATRGPVVPKGGDGAGIAELGGNTAVAPTGTGATKSAAARPASPGAATGPAKPPGAAVPAGVTLAESAGRRRGGVQRRKEAETESEVARAG